MDNNDVKKISVTSAQTSMPTVASASNNSEAKTTPTDGGDEFSDVKKEIATRFELLSEDMQNLITGSEYQMKLFEIAKSYKLTYEQLGTLELETTMVLLGMTKPDDFRDELQIELKLNDNVVDPVIADIEKQIFSPVHESIKKLYDDKAIAREDEVTGESSAPAFQNAPIATPAKNTLQNIPPITPASSTKAPTMSVPTAPSAIKDTITAGEKTVLENSGVILSEAPISGARQPMSLSQNDMKTPTPPTRFGTFSAPQNSNIVTDKMGTMGISITPKKETDYSVNKQTTPTPPVAPASSATDPYREPVN